MAPKSVLLTAGRDNLQKKTMSSKPMTTKEKLAAAKAKKANHKPTPIEPPTEAKWKPKSIPPPGEAFRVTKPTPTKKKTTRPGKPMTTKEKQRAAEVAKQATDGALAKKQAKEAVKGGGKANTPKRPSIFSAVKSQGVSTHQFVSKNSKLSVLVRPTARTKIFKGLLEANRSHTSSKNAKGTDEEHECGVFRIMDLPAELRNQIWKLSVVDPNFFVCPAIPTGREQPDLAMVSKQVREEILPIYYEFNTFGVELSSRQMPRGKLQGLAAIAKWSGMLEEKGWFGMIRRWSFDYTPSLGTGAFRRNEDNGSLIVSVPFTKRDDGSWTACAEVHRDACCLLPGRAEFEKCIVRESPKWLNKLVMDVVDAAKGTLIHGSMIVAMAKTINARVGELMDIKCQEGSWSFG